MLECSAFRELSCAGALQVAAAAAQRGFTSGDPDWCNLGQGQPDVGPIDGAPARITSMELSTAEQAYGPVGGALDLRRAVAEHYNRLFRSGYRSKYRAENVAIAAGGRLALARLVAALGRTQLGYRSPDYAGFEDLLAQHSHRVTPVLMSEVTGEDFSFSLPRFAQSVADRRLGACLISNPCNPTGQLLEGADLDSLLDIAAERSCTLIIDEFYSHVIYASDGSAGAGPVSAARHVKDVDRDAVLIVDGLTKNFRYPGWRIGWTLGPADMIEQIERAASSLDGGPPCVVQRAALTVLKPDHADRESAAVRSVFSRKRSLMVEALTQLGIRMPCTPRGTFYVWGEVGGLPAPLDDSDEFFRGALEHQVIVMPGRFFDINPLHDRPTDPRFRKFVRFSFGPAEETLRLAVSRLGKLVR